MFKAVVGRSRKHIVSPSKLLDVSQSLELRCVYDFDEERVQLHVSVDGIIENLEEDRTTKETSPFTINTEHSLALCVRVFF